MKKIMWGILYGVLLTAFTAYILLDTFVIERVYTPSGEGQTAATGDPAQPDKGTVRLTENSYSDNNISVTVTKHRYCDTAVYVADIQLKSAEYLKTALAKGVYGKNVTQTTSEMAAQNGAILAVNGDYYGAREAGFVLRNGELYRRTAAKGREDLVIYRDGSMEIISESKIAAKTLRDAGAQQILSFGPALVKEGKISVSQKQEVAQASRSNPRTAIGILGPLHYVMVVSDGRTDISKGLSLYELASFLQSIGTVTAYNLDGGGSATMVFNGRVVNRPTSNGSTFKERSVSDIVYIGY